MWKTRGNRNGLEVISFIILCSLLSLCLNLDCEMRGVYLQSVRSPALGNRYKMVHREFNHTAIFSQVGNDTAAVLVRVRLPVAVFRF